METEWAQLARDLAAVLREQEELDQRVRAVEARRGRLEHRLAQMHTTEQLALQGVRERAARGGGSWDSGVGDLPPVPTVRPVVPPFMPAVDVAPGYRVGQLTDEARAAQNERERDGSGTVPLDPAFRATPLTKEIPCSRDGTLGDGKVCPWWEAGLAHAHTSDGGVVGGAEVKRAGG